jgi:hypothetical protein
MAVRPRRPRGAQDRRAHSGARQRWGAAAASAPGSPGALAGRTNPTGPGESTPRGPHSNRKGRTCPVREYLLPTQAPQAAPGGVARSRPLSISHASAHRRAPRESGPAPLLRRPLAMDCLWNHAWTTTAHSHSRTKRHAGAHWNLGVLARGAATQTRRAARRDRGSRLGQVLSGWPVRISRPARGARRRSAQCFLCGGAQEPCVVPFTTRAAYRARRQSERCDTPSFAPTPDSHPRRSRRWRSAGRRRRGGHWEAGAPAARAAGGRPPQSVHAERPGRCARAGASGRSPVVTPSRRAQGG